MSTQNLPSSAFLNSSEITQRVHLAREQLSLHNQWRAYLIGLTVSDVIMLLVAYWLAFWIRFHPNLTIFDETANRSIQDYRFYILYLIPLWLLASYLYGLYDRRSLLDGMKEYSHVFHIGTFSMIVVMVFDFFFTSIIFARGWLLLFCFFSILFVSGSRFILRRIIYTLRTQGFFTSQALILGANEEGIALTHQLSAWQTSGLNVLGFIDDKTDVGQKIFEDYINLGKINQLESIIDQHGVEELILAGGLSNEDVIRIFKQYGMNSSINIRLSSGLFGLITNGLEVTNLAFVPLIRVQKMRFTKFENLTKLFLDYLVTSIVLLIIWPLFILIALLIRYDSPGPIIYRRRVMGQNGRNFDALKFRTMRIDGDEILEEHPNLKAELELNHKLKEDPRVTRIGKTLRQFSLDELPQLFNVLLRDMSLVGPRMISPEEMTLYGKWGMNLLTVKPGITGLWQVSGRSDTTYEKRVQLDMYYIRNWTIWSDIYLIWLTIPAVLKKRGAY